uniref:Small integral membrane protein 15 n=1 Tax=Arion vulgaris TaxID=1028688 RepID=A0A0B6Y8D1_9EUPU
MVEFGSGPIKETIDNTVFIIPGIVVVLLVGFFSYKLVSSLREKQRLREEKKKMKLQRKEKDSKKKK